MIHRGDLLILLEKEYRHGRGSIMIEIIAVGDMRHDAEGYWLPVKCEQRTWRTQPEVRFIEIRSTSIPGARSRSHPAGTLTKTSWGG